MSASETKIVEDSLASTLAAISRRDGEQKEFMQAVTEVGESLKPLFLKEQKYLDIFKLMVEPERAIHFRVPWVDDSGALQVNRGYRVQFNSALGPYKGGLRFHPTVSLSIVKFLGFEQILKNSLTTLPMGGGKGGSDFDPRGKSDKEVCRFCRSFMTELSRHIGPNKDVPAGDIGVGAREIGFLYGQYKRMKNISDPGVLTGKPFNFGGSNIRPEATGYGVVYLTQNYLATKNSSVEGKTCIVSGAGNVALFLTEKLIELKAKVVTLSDSGGFIHEPNGFSTEQLQWIKQLKTVRRGRISEYTEHSSTASYHEGKRPWAITADIAFPCATQNEIDLDDAKALVAGGVKIVSEGANMPSTSEAIGVYHEEKIVYLPAKAANAGGVACSGLEMSQNSIHLQWTREEVEERLQGIMKSIWDNISKTAAELGQPDNFQLGASVAGFKKVASAMILQGQNL